MALLFVIGMHAGYARWTLRSRLIALAVLTATATTGAAMYEFYDVSYFAAGIIRRMVPALMFCTAGFYYGRLLDARRMRLRPQVIPSSE